MVTYKQIALTETSATYEYYPEGDTKNPGIVKLYRKKPVPEAFEVVKKSDKDNIFNCFAKVLLELDKFNKLSDFKKEGMIAWY